MRIFGSRPRALWGFAAALGMAASSALVTMPAQAAAVTFNVYVDVYVTCLPAETAWAYPKTATVNTVKFYTFVSERVTSSTASSKTTVERYRVQLSTAFPNGQDAVLQRTCTTASWPYSNRIDQQVGTHLAANPATAGKVFPITKSWP